MGSGPARSPDRSATARAWAAVSGNGRPPTNWSTSVGPPSGRVVSVWRMPRASSWSRWRRSTRASCSRSSSSKASRRRAGSTSRHGRRPVDPGEGGGAVEEPAVGGGRPSGSGSANDPARSSASWTSRPIRAEVSAAFSVSG